MIRVYGKALVATWRPYEEGGASHMRSSQMQSEHVTVLDQVVIMQHKDGFWETYPLTNCSIIWQGKPSVTLLTDEDKETVLTISGAEHTLADAMAGHFALRGPTRAMSSSDADIEGR